jgi:hypothetical protein
MGACHSGRGHEAGYSSYPCRRWERDPWADRNLKCLLMIGDNVGPSLLYHADDSEVDLGLAREERGSNTGT